MNSTSYDLLTLALLLALTILVPILGAWDYRKLLRQIREGQAHARRKAYLWTIAVQWALTLGFLAWWLLSGGKLGALGLVPTAEGWQWLGIGAGVATVVFLLLQMRKVLRSPEQLAQVRQQTGELCGIAPQTPAEQRLFDLVSITAGICEETLYRGLLTAILAATLGIWPAVILVATIFGLGHIYQGWQGFGKTALVGLGMALLTICSGSLFIPMLVHAVTDLTSGRMLRAASQAAPETNQRNGLKSLGQESCCLKPTGDSGTQGVAMSWSSSAND
jgi:membrane protease YdiL (CAAX protease family)